MTSWIDDFEPKAALGLGANPQTSIDSALSQLRDSVNQINLLVAATSDLPAVVKDNATKIATATTNFSDRLLHVLDNHGDGLAPRLIDATRFDAVVGTVTRLGTVATGLEPYLAHVVSALKSLPKMFDSIPKGTPKVRTDLVSAFTALEAGVKAIPAQGAGGARHFGLAMDAAKAVLGVAPDRIIDIIAHFTPVAVIHQVATDLVTTPHSSSDKKAIVMRLEDDAFTLGCVQRLVDYIDSCFKFGLSIHVGGSVGAMLTAIAGYAAGPAAHLGLGGKVEGGVKAGTTPVEVTGLIGGIISAAISLARLVLSTRISWLKVEPKKVALADAAHQAEQLLVARASASDSGARNADAKEIESTLAGVRPQLEDVVRVVHPTLAAVDADANVYRVDAGAMTLYGPLESLLDAQVPPAATLALGEVLFTRSTSAITATGGLAGTGAQRRVNPYPGDVDLGEAILVKAATVEAAAAELAKAVQDGLARARAVTAPAPIVSLGMSLPGPGGTRQTWTADEIAAGKRTIEVAGKPETWTLAQAFAQSPERVPNSDWRAAIDTDVLWGEVTKVMTYRLVSSTDGSTFAQTPQMGQDYQSVAFGPLPFSDTSRVGLADQLAGQVPEKLAAGDDLKANKRAYTVSRIFDDLADGQKIAQFLSGTMPRLRQVTEQLALFTEEVIAPDGVGGKIVAATAAHTQLEFLAARVKGVDADQGAACASAIAAAPADPRGDGALTKALRAVVTQLEQVAQADETYRDQTKSMLDAMPYLFVSKPKALTMAAPTPPSTPATLDAAHAAWRAGELGAARAAYAKMTSWSAKLQLAWIDSAFAPVDSGALDALEKSAPNEAAMERVAVLRAHQVASTPLSGTPDDWSMHELLTQPGAETAHFWEEKARAAGQAAQYGLAHACLAHAASLSAAHAHDPSPALARSNTQAVAHLAALPGANP